MRFLPTPLPGAFLIEPESQSDDRGFFSRVFCQEEYEAAGLQCGIAQINMGHSAIKGTMRGLHYQLPPAAEAKTIRVTCGSLFDVIADLRPDSPTFRHTFDAELSAENRRMMYVPRGFAHGLLTLTDHVETVYFVSSPYNGALERGIRFDDPALGIAWPIEPRIISAKDQSWRGFDPAFHGIELLRDLH